MSENRKYVLSVRFTDRSVQHFAFPSQTDLVRIAAKIERLLESDALAFQLEGRLLVLSTRHIQSVEISPAPEPLPDTVIRNVRRL